ncbi:MAG: glucosamine-6-phosphate deaminase [Planctomycetota bacterium]
MNRLVSPNTETFSPQVVVKDVSLGASAAAADRFAEKIATTSDCVLGLATGGTPRDFYRLLAERDLCFSGVTTFNLDEYVGLAHDHPQSYRSYMRTHLFEKVGLDDRQTHFPVATSPTSDLQLAGAAYEKEIAAAGGIDLQLLGIGRNGHIAFNEPGASRTSRTRVVHLTESTIDANARFFDNRDQVPRQAISMGIASILDAKEIAVLAFGKQKSAAVAASLHGPVDASCPASFLRLHPNVTWYLDRDAMTSSSTEKSNA